MTTHVLTTSGGTVEVRAGDRLEIPLAENPTTGFRWQVRSLPPGVRLAGDELVVRTPVAPGSGAERRFLLEVEEPRAGAVHLDLRQPWDAAAPPAATFDVSVAPG